MVDVPRRNLDPFALYDAVSAHEILADLAVYWSSGCIASSMRLYYETFHSMDYMLSTQANVPHSVPVAMLDLPAEPFNAPERWTRFHYPGIVQYTRGDSGGHFAALE